MDSVTTYRNTQTGGVNPEKFPCKLKSSCRKSTSGLCVQYIIHKRVKTLAVLATIAQQDVGYDLKARIDGSYRAFGKLNSLRLPYVKIRI